MIIRASAKFQKHFHCKADPSGNPIAASLQAWNVDVFRHRNRQLIVLASEERSLFSFLLPLTLSRDINQFSVSFQRRLNDLLDANGIEERPDFSRMRIHSRTDRRIIGSQNELLFFTKSILMECRGSMDATWVTEAEKEINSIPMSFLDRGSPDRAIQNAFRPTES